MEQRLSLVTLGVADLVRSARFYEEGLGWRRATDDAGVVFFQMPGTLLSLYPLEALAADVGIPAGERTGFNGVTLAFNARSREDVDATLLQAVQAGATMVKPAADAFWGGYSGYFADLDGHLWEVAHNPFWTIGPDGSVAIGG